MDTHDAITESTGDSASRIIELGELSANVTEETKQVFATLSEYKVVSRNVQDNLAKEDLTSMASLRENKRMQLEVQQLRAKYLLSTAM